MERGKKTRQERVGSVTANPDNLEIRNEAVGEAKCTQGSSKHCTNRESVSSSSRLIWCFRNKYQCECYRMTRMTWPDCAVMCNLMHTHTHTPTHTNTNEISSGIGNGDEDGSGDEDGNGIGEGGAGVEKHREPFKSCRRKQALSFRMRHHLCRQGVALAGTQQLCSQCPVSVHAHRTEVITESE